MDRAASLRAGLVTTGPLETTPAEIDQRITAHAFHLFSMTYNSDVLGGLPRDRLVAALQAEGVPAVSGYPYPIYHNELFKDRPHIVHPCPEAESYCRSSVWLPQNALLADEEWIAQALSAINKVCANADSLFAHSTERELSLPVSES
jgi:dTDP-4-amino-4,6-dideoxygalactose transaminase